MRLAVLLLTAISGGAHAAETLEQLLARLTADGLHEIRFVEWRESPLLEQPLETRGTLAFTPPDHFEKQIESPYRETQTIADGRVEIARVYRMTRSFALHRAPELQALTTALAGLLQGDAAAITAAFEHTLTSDDDTWTLDLKPRDAALVERVRCLRFTGLGDAVSGLHTTLASGEVIRTEFETPE